MVRSRRRRRGLRTTRWRRGGLVTLTYYLASEYGADNVRANCIAPGPVPTDLNRPFLGTPEGRAMTGATIQFSLVPADARAPSEPGNVFAIGSGKHSLQGRTVVTAAWSGPTKLTISYTKGAAVMRSAGRVGPIEIEYAFLKDGVVPM